MNGWRKAGFIWWVQVACQDPEIDIRNCECPTWGSQSFGRRQHAQDGGTGSRPSEEGGETIPIQNRFSCGISQRIAAALNPIHKRSC